MNGQRSYQCPDLFFATIHVDDTWTFEFGLVGYHGVVEHTYKRRFLTCRYQHVYHLVSKRLTVSSQPGSYIRFRVAIQWMKNEKLFQTGVV